MSITNDLERLAELHRSGALSDAEFASAKARALGSSPHGADGLVDGLHALRRSRSDRWLGGVCGGLAPATGLPSWLWTDLLRARRVRRHRPDRLWAALDPAAQGGPGSGHRHGLVALDLSVGARDRRSYTAAMNTAKPMPAVSRTTLRRTRDRKVGPSSRSWKVDSEKRLMRRR